MSNSLKQVVSGGRVVSGRAISGRAISGRRVVSGG